MEFESQKEYYQQNKTNKIFKFKIVIFQTCIIAKYKLHSEHTHTKKKQFF